MARKVEQSSALDSETSPNNPATPEPPAAAARPAADPDRVAQRAYERFKARGGEPGRDKEDWFEAERDLDGTARD